VAEFVYIDYPELLLYARRLSAVKLGRAEGTKEAATRRINDPIYRFDLKTLYAHFVGIDYPHLCRGTFFSSAAPLQHRVMEAAQKQGSEFPAVPTAEPNTAPRCAIHIGAPAKDAHDRARKNQDIITIVATPQFLSGRLHTEERGVLRKLLFLGPRLAGPETQGIEFDKLDPFCGSFGLSLT